LHVVACGVMHLLIDHQRECELAGLEDGPYRLRVQGLNGSADGPDRLRGLWRRRAWSEERS
jgi:hypothetical protein